MQLTPGGCSADPCLAACSGRANGLLYFNARGQFRFSYQWLLQPGVGVVVPNGCSCEQFSCVYSVAAPPGITSFSNSQELMRSFLSASAPLLAGTGAPFSCVKRNGTGSSFNVRQPARCVSICLSFPIRQETAHCLLQPRCRWAYCSLPMLTAACPTPCGGAAPPGDAVDDWAEEGRRSALFGRV